MKLLVDDNNPRLCVERLCQAGHDVAYVAETGSGQKDPNVLQRAGSEARLLITEDRDFGTLV